MNEATEQSTFWQFAILEQFWSFFAFPEFWSFALAVNTVRSPSSHCCQWQALSIGKRILLDRNITFQSPVRNLLVGGTRWENSTFFTGICNITNCNHNVWMEHQIPKNRRWSNTIYLLFLLSSNITITPRPPCFPNNPENECTAPPREKGGMILVHVAAAVKIRLVDTNPSGAANYSQISLYMANSSRQKTNITKMNQIKTFWSPWQSSLVNISLGGSVTALLAKLGPVQFGSSGISDAGGLARTQTSAQGEL